MPFLKSKVSTGLIFTYNNKLQAQTSCKSRLWWQMRLASPGSLTALEPLRFPKQTLQNIGIQASAVRVTI